MDGKLGLESVRHLDERVVGLVAEELDARNVSVDGEKVEELVSISFLWGARSLW